MKLWGFDIGKNNVLGFIGLKLGALIHLSQPGLGIEMMHFIKAISNLGWHGGAVNSTGNCCSNLLDDLCLSV